MMRYPSLNKQNGFTLIEILVALAVLAISMAAIIQASSQYVSNQVYLQKRTEAHWVARNLLVGFRMSKQWPSISTKTGVEEWGGQEWSWQLKVSQTPDQDLRRLDIEVGLEQDDEVVLANLSGFKARLP
ncbi:MAG: type II secretion system minor pseudopilin GspI [Gammaproteobacteria bacterium]|nr:type II secretion system minor pseudopilin GspI [Gammaproteobacteria bacterium]